MPDKSLGETIFEGAAKGYRSLFGAENLPLDKRIYMESVIDRRRDPITERSLNADEQEQLRSLIASRYERIKPELKQDMVDLRKNAAEALREASATRDPETRAWHLNRYKGISQMLNGIKSYFETGKLNPAFVDYAKNRVPTNIQREDYENPDEINSDRGSSLSSPGRDTNIGQTLGRFNYGVDNAGNLLVTDAYDFGAGVAGLFGGEAGHRQKPIGVSDLISPKQAAAKLGYRRLPEGQGRPVKIKINSMAPKKKEETNYFSRAAAYLGF